MSALYLGAAFERKVSWPGRGRPSWHGQPVWSPYPLKEAKQGVAPAGYKVEGCQSNADEHTGSLKKEVDDQEGRRRHYFE